MRRFPTKPSQLAIRNHMAAMAGLRDGVVPVLEKSRTRKKQGAPEKAVMDAVREWARLKGITLFRNNCGQYEAAPGRWVRFGLGVGSSDLIGFRTVNGVAQFVAIECKAPGKNATAEQQEFIDNVRAAGGVAGVARSIEDCEEICR